MGVTGVTIWLLEVVTLQVSLKPSFLVLRLCFAVSVSQVLMMLAERGGRFSPKVNRGTLMGVS